MARHNRTSQMKREREQKKRDRQRRKAEKAALKREKRFRKNDAAVAGPPLLETEAVDVPVEATTESGQP